MTQYSPEQTRSMANAAATWTSGTVPTLTDTLQTNLNGGNVVTVSSGTHNIRVVDVGLAAGI